MIAGHNVFAKFIQRVVIITPLMTSNVFQILIVAASAVFAHIDVRSQDDNGPCYSALSDAEKVQNVLTEYDRDLLLKRTEMEKRVNEILLSAYTAQDASEARDKYGRTDQLYCAVALAYVYASSSAPYLGTEPRKARFGQLIALKKALEQIPLPAVIEYLSAMNTPITHELIDRIASLHRAGSAIVDVVQNVSQMIKKEYEKPARAYFKAKYRVNTVEDFAEYVLNAADYGKSAYDVLSGIMNIHVSRENFPYVLQKFMMPLTRHLLGGSSDHAEDTPLALLRSVSGWTRPEVKELLHLFSPAQLTDAFCSLMKLHREEEISVDFFFRCIKICRDDHNMDRKTRDQLFMQFLFRSGARSTARLAAVLSSSKTVNALPAHILVELVTMWHEHPECKENCVEMKEIMACSLCSLKYRELMHKLYSVNKLSEALEIRSLIGIEKLEEFEGAAKLNCKPRTSQHRHRPY
ncbi:hypothetical protein PAPHI01_0364 [Pancytospora philotis]|nr:hypothetical protein PAPHI01_0364 [Pancytospora philotis]